MTPPLEQTEPILPNNRDAEATVLGALLISVEGSAAAFDRLKTEDFHSSDHQCIFKTMLEMREKNQPVDLLLLHEELIRNGQIERAGGIGYVAQLGDGIYKKIHLESYVKIVKDKAALRNVIHLANAAIQESFQATESASAILDRAADAFVQLAHASFESTDGISNREAAGRLLSLLDRRGGVRVFTDVQSLDRIIGGFRDGELVVLTAETGVGKTLFAQQIRRRACRDGYHSLYASGEMSAPHLISRELASVSGVPHSKMRQPEQITTAETRSLIEHAQYECEHCLILDGELSIGRIGVAARQMKMRHGIGLVVLDYDELIDAPGKDEFDQQRSLVRGAKSIAIELGCPALLISQLRKPMSGEDAKRPTLQRLYGSGAKAKHASTVIYVDREFARELKPGMDETAARIVVVKNRDGRVGALEAKFNIKTLRFESMQVEQSSADSRGGSDR
jgi:replicative DNA helicase